MSPFAGYTDFEACVAANRDKADPKAYCATIMRKAEGRFPPPPRKRTMSAKQRTK